MVRDETELVQEQQDSSELQILLYAQRDLTEGRVFIDETDTV